MPKKLSHADYTRLRRLVQIAMADRHLTGPQLGAALGVQPRRIYAAIGEPFQPGLLIRLGEWLGVWPVRP